MADGTLPNGEHLPGNEQIPQVPQKPKESLDQIIAEGRVDYLKETLALETDAAKKEASQLSGAAKTENDPEAEATNQEVAALNAEADSKLSEAKKQAESEIDQVTAAPKDVAITEKAGVVESLEGDSVETTHIEAPEPESVPSEKRENESKPVEPIIETPKVVEKPEMPDFQKHFMEAQGLIEAFKQNNNQAGPSELRRLVKLMAAAHPDRFSDNPQVAAFSTLLGRLKMAFSGDGKSWEGYEADFQKLKQEIGVQADADSVQEPKVESGTEPRTEAPSQKESYPSPEEQIQSLDASANSAKQRMRELYDELMKMKLSGGELDETELGIYKKMLDEDPVLNAFVEKMQSEFRNSKNTEAVRTRAAQYAAEFAQGARAQVAYAEGIATPKPTAEKSSVNAPVGGEAIPMSPESAEDRSTPEKKQQGIEKQVFARLRKMDVLVDQIISDKQLDDGAKVALRDQLEQLQLQNVKDWDELSALAGAKNEALFDMQQNMTDTLNTLDQLLAENDPGARAVLEKQVQGFRQASGLEVSSIEAFFAQRDAELSSASSKPESKTEKVDEKAEAERRMAVMEELLTGKIRKVEEAYDEVLESGDEVKIEACTQLLSRLYAERMADLTKDINAYYKKKPSERTPKSEKQVGIWLYEEELLGAQMDANLKKREIAGLKREKQVIDLEISDLQALIDRSTPTGPNLQLAGAPTKEVGSMLPESSAGLALVREAKSETGTENLEELSKKMQVLLAKQSELAAKIGLGTVALGEMYRQIDRIVKARAKDLEELKEMKDVKKVALVMESKPANDNAQIGDQDAKIQDKDYSLSGEGGGGGRGSGWFERVGDAVAMAMHGDEASIGAAGQLFEDFKNKIGSPPGSKKAA